MNELRLSAEQFIGSNYHLSVEHKNLTGEYQMHCHDFFEIEFLLAGSGIQIINGIKYEISKGNFYMITPADFHSVTIIDEIKICTIAFDDSIISSRFLQLLLCKKVFDYKFTDEELAIANNISELMYTSQHETKQYNKDFVQNLLECLFIMMLRYLRVNEEEWNPEITPISKVITYLNFHFRESPSLVEVAKIAGMSSGYFSVLFSKTIGKSYIDYLTDLKLNCARTLLASDTMSISELCYACGFSSFSNFFRAFKKETGLSPRDYRKETHKAKQDS